MTRDELQKILRNKGFETDYTHSIWFKEEDSCVYELFIYNDAKCNVRVWHDNNKNDFLSDMLDYNDGIIELDKQMNALYQVI